jgi:pilus assembly protein CpaF
MNREEDLYRRTLKYFLKPIWEPYLEDASVSEIMINGIDEVYIERGGKLEKTETRFPDNDYLMAAVRNVAQYTGKRITPETSRFDSRLPDGSRVHVVLPPSSRNGIVIAVRKFSRQAIDLDRLVEYKSLTPESREFLSIAVLLHQNIIVSGGTSSGKTSLLNALAGAIPEKQRIIVLEDSTELKIPREHVLYFEARAADRHGLGQVTIRDLFHSSLRLRPDRIIIGEIRGGEALDMIQAMTSGHSGSMSTLHANNPRDSLNRLETMALMSGIDMPLYALRSQVASAINVVVQATRLVNGARRITHISEILPLSEKGEYRLQDIFRLQHSESGAEDGCLTWTGVVPSFAADLAVHGLHREIQETQRVFGLKPKEG